MTEELRREARERFRTGTDLLSVLSCKRTQDLIDRFVEVLKPGDEEPALYPSGLVATTYRDQQVDLNAHPADFGADCPRDRRFVLAYRDRDLRFLPVDGIRGHEPSIGFGTVWRVQHGVVEVLSDDDCNDDCDEDLLCVKARMCAERLARLRQAEVDFAKGVLSEERVQSLRRAYNETTEGLHCRRADPDSRVREGMRRMFELGMVAVNMRLLRKHVGAWVCKKHVLSESSEPTVVRLAPGWYCLRALFAGAPGALRRLKLFVLTSCPRERMRSKLREFVPERVHPLLEPHKQNLRLAAYVNATIEGLAGAR